MTTNSTASVDAKTTLSLTSASDDSHFEDLGFLREKQVLRLVSFSRATLWRRVKSGDFPMPVKLSPGITVWIRAQVKTWMSEKVKSWQQ